jgi:putative ABC transport system ATP-binding protein
MTDLFTFEDVTVTVDDVTVLAGVSSAIPSNRLTVLAGVSGSGKTSLLRLCNRLDVPTSGTLRFRGNDLALLDPLDLRRRVGMVFQRPVLFGGTVRDNLRVADPEASEQSLADALHGVELGAEFLDRHSDDLSGGEAQRVCLARALLCGPEVLLMDEPTAALHPAARRGLETTVQTLHAGRSLEVVWVTHDLEQIDRMATHLIILSDGIVVYGGDPDTQSAREALATLNGEAL